MEPPPAPTTGAAPGADDRLGGSGRRRSSHTRLHQRLESLWERMTVHHAHGGHHGSSGEALATRHSAPDCGTRRGTVVSTPEAFVSPFL